MSKCFPFITKRKYSESEGINSDSSWDVTCQAIAKSQSDVSPYLIANEWICASIAQFLKLPVPPFALMGGEKREKVMFASYSFSGQKRSLVDADPEILYRCFPYECTGIVLFDILIANCDRHSRNIKVDKPVNPTNFYIIDHERALFFIYPKEGAKRLADCTARLGITDGTDSRSEFHCLLGEVDSVENIQKWVTRIESIPDWFIEDTCNQVQRISIKKSECKAVIEFLKNRRDKLKILVLDHKHRFKKIKKTEWPLFL